MNANAIKRMELRSDLALLPEEDLDKVRDFVGSLLSQANVSKRSRSRSLKGIWAGTGLEKLKDLEGALDEVRQELGDSILRRRFG